MKKVAIVGSVLVVLGLITALIIFNMDWGERVSSIDKTDIEEVVDSADASGVIKPSLDELSGLYTVDTENGKAELLFEVDGLKNTKGAFEKFSVSFDIAENYSSSHLIVDIDAASLNTNNKMRDEHLVDPGYFDVKKYPSIKFESTQVSFLDTAYTATGNLDFVGASNELTINFDHKGGKDLDNGIRIEVFEGSFTFDRTKYGMEEESGIGNDVTISFYVELEKQS